MKSVNVQLSNTEPNHAVVALEGTAKGKNLFTERKRAAKKARDIAEEKAKRVVLDGRKQVQRDINNKNKRADKPNRAPDGASCPDRERPPEDNSQPPCERPKPANNPQPQQKAKGWQEVMAGKSEEERAEILRDLQGGNEKASNGDSFKPSSGARSTWKYGSDLPDMTPALEWGELLELTDLTKCLPNINNTYKEVDEAALSGHVLCAPREGSSVFSWDKLARPRDLANEYVQYYEQWEKKSTWMKVFGYGYNEAHFSISGKGKYNYVLAKKPGSSTDPNDWPPQLGLAGIDKGPINDWADIDVKRQEVLPSTAADPLIRITRGNENPDLSMSRGQYLKEATFALHAATTGLGPPIFAIVPFEYPVNSENEQRYGMTMVMMKAPHDFARYTDMLISMTASGTQSPGFIMQRASFCANAIQKLSFRAACLGAIAFDIKPGNVIIDQSGKSFYLIDYDDHFFITDAAIHKFVGLKARTFVNLLLFTMHVRAYINPNFSEAFCATLRKPLMDMWIEICKDEEMDESKRSFGPGGHWLFDMKTPINTREVYHEGAFSKIADPQTRFWQQFRMIAVHYFLSPAARSKYVTGRDFPWNTTQKGFGSVPRLIPQMLEFALFHGNSTMLSVAPEHKIWMEALKEAHEKAPGGSPGGTHIFHNLGHN